MVFSDWSRLSWGDISTLEYGKRLTGYKEKTEGYPVFGTNGQVGYTDKPLVNSSGVIIGRKGAYRGVEYTDKPFYVIDTAFYLKPKDSIQLDLKWSYYSLLTTDINRIDSGSAIPSTSRNDFYNLEVNLPPLDEQKRIANFLSNLDKKIDLNNKINKKLEGMAQAIFKKWFVDFEFPNENSNFLKSIGGEMVWCDELEKNIPNGWDVVNIENYASKMANGGTPSRSKEEYWNKKEFPWIKTGEIKNCLIIDAEESISQLGLDNSSAKLFPINTILIAMYGATAGQVGLLRFEATTNQACCGIICHGDSSPYYLYLNILNNQEYLKSLATGSAQQNLSKNIIANMKILYPDLDLLNQFDKLVSPFFDKMEVNSIENKKLSLIRDTLLPKLMSGELRVPVK